MWCIPYAQNPCLCSQTLYQKRTTTKKVGTFLPLSVWSPYEKPPQNVQVDAQVQRGERFPVLSPPDIRGGGEDLTLPGRCLGSLASPVSGGNHRLETPRSGL